MRLADRYTLSELLVPLIIGGTTILMMLIGNTLYAYLEFALKEGWPLAIVVRALYYNIPVVLVFALPVGAAIGASLAIGRLGRDNELTALRSVGVSVRRALASVFLVGVALSLFSAYVAERVVPRAWKQQQSVANLLDSLPTSPISVKQTLDLESYVVSFEKAQKSQAHGFRMSDVTLIDKFVEPNAAPGSWPRLFTAAHADYTGSIFTLTDVRLFEFEPDGSARYESATMKSGKLFQNVDFSRASMNLGEEQLINLSFAELTRQMEATKKFGDGRRARECDVNRWFKFGLPAMCLPCALCGAALALRFARGGGFAGVLLSLVVVFLGWGVFTACKFAALAGKLPAAPAAFLSAVLFAGLALWQLRSLE
jgi:lipopolysaccharide export LptBFGC system permease protein LptF